MGVLALFGVAIASIFSWRISRNMSRAVTDLLRGVEIVSRGNVDHRFAVTSQDEFGQLASAFNRMLERLRKAGTLLRDKESQLVSILETAPYCILTINAKGLIETFNRSAERTFGYQVTEVVGYHFSMLFPGDVAKAASR